MGYSETGKKKRKVKVGKSQLYIQEKQKFWKGRTKDIYAECKNRTHK